jgi:hypothetical protein
MAGVLWICRHKQGGCSGRVNKSGEGSGDGWMSEWAVCMRILIDLRSSKVFRSAALYKLTLVQRFVPQYFFSERINIKSDWWRCRC